MSGRCEGNSCGNCASAKSKSALASTAGSTSSAAADTAAAWRRAGADDSAAAACTALAMRWRASCGPWSASLSDPPPQPAAPAAVTSRVSRVRSFMSMDTVLDRALPGVRGERSAGLRKQAAGGARAPRLPGAKAVIVGGAESPLKLLETGPAKGRSLGPAHAEGPGMRGRAGAGRDRSHCTRTNLSSIWSFGHCTGLTGLAIAQFRWRRYSGM
jgi:hypothetical protein